MDAYGQGIETVRLGTAFASNADAYRSWKRRQDRHTGRSSALTGRSLESAVMGLARQNPEYVVMGA